MKIQYLLILIIVLFQLSQAFPQRKQNIVKFVNKIVGNNFLNKPQEEPQQTNKAPQSKLAIEIYSEVLCPDCQNFTSGSFQKALKTKNFLDYVDIKMYFHGNAEEKYNPATKKYQYNCQHGLKECEGNHIANCAISTIGNQQKALEVIICFEQEIKRYAQPALIQYDKIIQKCYKSNNLGESKLQGIIKCHNGEEGHNLQHIAAQKTEQQKDLKYVPWILTDGKHDVAQQKEIIKDLVSFTCLYYKQKRVIPPFCSRKKLLKMN